MKKKKIRSPNFNSHKLDHFELKILNELKQGAQQIAQRLPAPKDLIEELLKNMITAPGNEVPNDGLTMVLDRRKRRLKQKKKTKNKKASTKAYYHGYT